MSEAAPRRAPARSTIERRLLLARAAVAWERLWPRLWPAIGVGGLFLVLSLFDVWGLLPGWLHLAGLIAFAAGLLLAVALGLRGFALPDRGDARRRLELESGLTHRPLTALEDQLADQAADPATSALWEAHRARLAASVRQLRIGVPRPGLAKRDPWALRAALLLVAVVAGAVANEDAERRLARAFLPDLSGVRAAPAVIDAWISPPAYTGLPPIFLTRESGIVSTAEAPLRVPVGSTLLARVHGGRGVPALHLAEETAAFEAVDARNHQLSREIRDGSSMGIEQDGSTLASWRIAVVPDQVPGIAFAEPPQATERQALRIAYAANDDYGLAKVAVEIRRPGEADVLELPLTLPGLNPRTAAEAAFHDLTPHPWAGLQVQVTLAAQDAIGQRGTSETVQMTLPEREFEHPVARAVIEQRKLLTMQPDRRRLVALALGAIALVDEAYGADTVVYLGLRTARNRLLNEAGPAATAAVQELLWEVALRIEDGTLSLAERELRQAQRELMDALARNAPDAEIERLMDQLQQAMDRFLQAMAEEAMRQAMERGEIEELPPGAERLTPQDLQRMLDQAREMSRSGSRDAARDMLSQLQNMLENLKGGRVARQPGQQGGEQALQEMGEMMRRQQQLLDQTYRRSQQGQQGQQGQRGQRMPGQRGRQGQPGEPGQSGQPGEGMEGMAGEQEALRRMLGEMMRRLGEGGGDIPGALGRAERSMRESRDALGQGEPGGAVGPQTDALDQLRQGAQSMLEQMLGDMGEGPGEARQGRAGNDRADPLGRPLPGQWDNGDATKVPDQADMQRAREILEELYRRSGDRQRPEVERDYIDRLLRRF